MTAVCQKIWRPNEIIELVAWLEFCVQNRLDFKKTIASHLDESIKITGEERKFSERQACDKLIDLARRTYGSGQYVGLERILLAGKECFTELPANTNAEITAAFNACGSKYAHMLDKMASDRQEVAHSKLHEQVEGQKLPKGHRAPDVHVQNTIFPNNVSCVHDQSAA
jgi:hypothetical protein